MGHVLRLYDSSIILCQAAGIVWSGEEHRFVDSQLLTLTLLFSPWSVSMDKYLSLILSPSKRALQYPDHGVVVMIHKSA